MRTWFLRALYVFDGLGREFFMAIYNGELKKSHCKDLMLIFYVICHKRGQVFHQGF